MVLDSDHPVCGSRLQAAEEIKIGALMDMTGATSDVGKDYAIGMDEAIKYVNDNGGVNGKTIKLYQFDYGYRIPEAITKYNLFKQTKMRGGPGMGNGRHRSPVAHGQQG